MLDAWKPIVGWEGVYSVSSVGRVRYEQDRPSNRFAVHAGDIVPQSMDPDGYFVVELARVGERSSRRTLRVNRLVAEAFIGPPPSPRAQADHVNHRRGDNAFSNLEWVSCKENIQRAIKVGIRDFRGERCWNAKLTTRIVLKIRERAARGESFAAIARDVGVSNVNVANVATGKTWTHVSGPRVAKR
jgi:hypothetical protein